MNYCELLVLFTVLISPASARSIPVRTLKPRYNISIEQQDPYYVEQLLNWRDFGQATPANRMKFAFTEQRQGIFNLTEAEIFMSAVNPPGMPQKEIRCHPLIWHQTLPNWLTAPSTPWTNATLTAVLVNHVKYLVSYFGDRCAHWDVVNEAFSESNISDPAFPYRSINNIWYQIIGPEYITMAFKAASEVVREKGLNVKLYYNDYGIESPGSKHGAAVALVQSLQARNIRIDGIDFESHFLAGGTPNQTRQEQAMRAFTDLGIDVAVTELDVRVPLPLTAVNERRQAQDYYNTVAACMNVERCVGLTLWDFVDTYSWVPSSFAGFGSAHPWAQPGGSGSQLQRKDRLFGVIMQALSGQSFVW